MPAETCPPVLRTHGLTVRYGGVRANDDISLSVPRATIVGLIGPNGAGKTTFIDAVTGFTPCTGSVYLDGERLDGVPAHTRARRGLARTWQSLELFPELTVQENLLVAAQPVRWRTAFRDLVRPAQPRPGTVDAALDLLGLGELAHRRPPELSLGQRKLVGVARALAARPRLVLLDEPAAGLDGAESADLGRRLGALPAAGIGVLLVDHDMDLVLDVCSTIHVLEFGRLIASGTATGIRTDERVLAAYLGDPTGGRR